MHANWIITDYVAKHGRKPRGLGNWAFIPADSVWPTGQIPEDGIAWEYGTYSQAKTEVARRYPSVWTWLVLA